MFRFIINLTCRYSIRVNCLARISDVHSKLMALNNSKKYQNAIALFNSYPQSSLNDIAINQALRACLHLNEFNQARLIHERLSPKSKYCRHIQVTLIQIYSRCQDIESARNVFQAVRENQRTTYLYTAMINALKYNGRFDEALDLISNMTITPDPTLLSVIFDTCTQSKNSRALQIGRRFLQKLPSSCEDVVALTSAIHMLSTAGDWTIAESVFNRMKRKDIAAYNTMIKCYNQNDEPVKSLEIFEKLLQAKVSPDLITFLLVINACAKIGMIACCQRIVSYVPVSALKNKNILNALIDMWGKAGLVDEAYRIFTTIDKPDAISYGAMINTYGINGRGSLAVELYRHTPVDMHNEIIHISTINACSHSGLVDDARQIFSQIVSKTCKITTSMVDCLSRKNELDEALKIIDDYETSNQPHPVMYMAFLSATRNQKNLPLARTVFERFKKIFPGDNQHVIAASVLLANTYSLAGKKGESIEIRKEINQFETKKEIGQSWTYVNGQIVSFSAHDHSHPRSQEIYSEIERISAELKANGHHYESSWVTRPMSNDETIESVLCGHSEKLAIAFNFIQNPVPSPIQITKNLRVCGDCHAATKLLARIRQHTIIVRDTNRIHHFYPDGHCSCNDYF